MLTRIMLFLFNRDMYSFVIHSLQLVGEKFDLENNFLVRSSVNVRHLLKFMNHCSEKLQVRSVKITKFPLSSSSAYDFDRIM